MDPLCMSAPADGCVKMHAMLSGCHVKNGSNHILRRTYHVMILNVIRHKLQYAFHIACIVSLIEFSYELLGIQCRLFSLQVDTTR